MKKFRTITIGLLISCMLMATSPVLANSIMQKIDVVLNSVKVQVNGENKNIDSILYNGTTYLPMRKVAELVDKDIEWSSDTMTANIIDKKVVSEELPYIIKQEFVNNGTSTVHAVAFSDGFGIGMALPKRVMPELNDSFECVFLTVNVKNMKDTFAILNPNIVGFNEIYDDKYYPLSFDIYGDGLPSNLYDRFKALDFYENFKLYQNGDSSITGMIYYESFPFLDGITYDDGVHKCNLYLFDNGNRGK